MLAKATSNILAIPSIVGVIIPVALSFIDPWRFGGFKVGLIIFGLGLASLLVCLIDFASKAKDTIGSLDPPEKLVKKGPYRYVRNPIYLGILLMVGGIEIITASVILGIYLLILIAAFHLKIILIDEPSLAKKFPEWLDYAKNVPRWIPRLRPWRE